MHKKYKIFREASDQSMRERLDINERSVEEMIKFTEQDPDTIEYQDIINEVDKKARDINTMSIELKTRLLQTMRGGRQIKNLHESIKNDYLNSISKQQYSQIINNQEFGIFTNPDATADSVIDTTVVSQPKRARFEKSIKEQVFL